MSQLIGQALYIDPRIAGLQNRFVPLPAKPGISLSLPGLFIKIPRTREELRAWGTYMRNAIYTYNPDEKLALFGVFDNKDTLLYNLDLIYPPIVDHRWLVPRTEELKNKHFVARMNACAPEDIKKLILGVIRTHIRDYSP